MQKGFTREESRNLCSRLGDDPEVSVQGQGTETITVGGTRGGEAGAEAEAEEGMSVIGTVEGRETLTIEAEAAVPVQMIVDIAVEIDMTTTGAVEVVLMAEVPLL